MTQWLMKLVQTLLGRDAGLVADKWQAYAVKIERRLDEQDAKLATCEERHFTDQRRIAELELTVVRLEAEIRALRGA